MSIDLFPYEAEYAAHNRACIARYGAETAYPVSVLDMARVIIDEIDALNDEDMHDYCKRH